MQGDRVHIGVGVFVWIATLVVYTLTKAPTLSFWDCGEFIAVSHILGIPHPPGTPLYVLVGRIFSIIPLFEDICARVNFLSSLSNAVTAFFGYLIAVRMLRSWLSVESGYNRLLVYGGAAAGAFFLAFGLTQWTNSVEAEVYGMAMMFFTAIFWLALVYFENRGTPFADRLMLLMVYLIVLSVGVHMTTMLLLPVIAIFLVLKRNTPSGVWYVIAALLLFELFLIFALSSLANELNFTLPVAIVFVVYLFYLLSFDRIPPFTLAVAGGFVVSMLPLWGSLAGVTSTILDTISLLSLIAMSVVSLYSLLKWWGSKSRGALSNDYRAVSAVFVFAAGLMSLITVIDSLHTYETFKIMSALALTFLAVIAWRHVRWPILIALTAVALLVVGINQFFVGLLAAAVLILIVGLLFRLPEWKNALMILLVAVAGFSVHLFIPIRAAQKPAINENNPAVSIAEMIENPTNSLKPLIGFLERKQYGNQSMLERMFSRRAEWKNQFGVYRRMGFWHFFSEQYGISGPKFFVFVVLGIFGVWELVRRRPELGLSLAMILLLTSVGLILYMNFADGTRQLSSGADYIEVRERDYFFTPAFVVFGLAIGMGITSLVQLVRETTSTFGSRIQKALAVVLPLLFLLPVVSLAGNYHRCDRSNNYIPFDYANSLLASADPGAVLFTNGDNDTFPLWCLQEVYGIRTDVRNVNLSLANTRWYIEQIQDQKGLDLGWTREQISKLGPYRLPNGRVVRLQDQVVDAIVEHNGDSVPINFSVTCGAGARQLRGRPIDSLLELSGLKFRLKKSGERLTVNVEESIALLMDTSKVRARGVADPEIYKDEASVRTTSNMVASYLTVADALRNAGELERAEEIIRYARRRYPHVGHATYALAMILAERGRVEELEGLRDSVGDGVDDARIAVALARAYRGQKDDQKAANLLEVTLASNPKSRPVFRELLQVYVSRGEIQKVTGTIRRWLRDNPGDTQARRFLDEIESGRLLTPKNQKPGP